MDILELECYKLKVQREEFLISLEDLSLGIGENILDVVELEEGRSNNLRLYLKIKNYLSLIQYL